MLLIMPFIFLLNTHGSSMAVPFSGPIANSISNHSNQVSIVTLDQSDGNFYNYEPYVTLTGSNYIDIPSNTKLMLSKFTIAMWFRTTMDVPYKSEAFILNKGGIGSDNMGANLNYGIWMTGSETIRPVLKTHLAHYTKFRLQMLQLPMFFMSGTML